MTEPQAEVGIQPLVNWPRTVEAGHSYRVTVDLRLTDPAAWRYDEEELVVGCMIDGRPTCRVLALGDAGVVLHRFGGSYGPAQFLVEVPEDQTDFADAALWLTLTTAGGVPFYTGKLPMDGSALFAEDGTAERTATEAGGKPVPSEEDPAGSGPGSGAVPGTTAAVPIAGRTPRGAAVPGAATAGQPAQEEAPREASTSLTDVSPETFIVRVLRRDGSVAGLGMLVAGRQIVTCAHVVNVALGQDPRAEDQPDATVLVDFPLATPGRKPLKARVAAWEPSSRAGAAGSDVAGLELVDRHAPEGTRPGKLAVEMPRPGDTLRVFGYPARPPGPAGGWVTVTVRGSTGFGRIQLESEPGSVQAIQPEFSGTPLFDDTVGRVVGLVSAAGSPAGSPDSYAIDADRLRLAWPEALAGRWQRGRPRTELTILHVSDIQWGRDHLFGGTGLISATQGSDALTSMLRDLEGLGDNDLHADLIVITGDLTESGSRGEFGRVSEFLTALTEVAQVPRRHVAIIPGNHDVNRRAARAYFLEAEDNDVEPVPPYWPKWRNYASAFTEFYANVPGAMFTPDEPWSLFEMPDLGVVVAGLNSTIADSHLDEAHYGYVGGRQLQWFADRLAAYQAQGWLRLAAVHHNVAGRTAPAEDNLRDARALDRTLGKPGLINLLLHGSLHSKGTVIQLSSGLPLLSTGISAVSATSRPAEVHPQYQLIAIRPDGFTRYARQYVPDLRRWIGDTGISSTGTDWRVSVPLQMADAYAPFQPVTRKPSVTREPSASDREDFLHLVAAATRARYPDAAIAERPGGDCPYLRATRRSTTGLIKQWPIGVIDGPATEEALEVFIAQVHTRFVAADPQVPSELVYRGPSAPTHLGELARRRGVRLRSFADYQELLDLSQLARAQRQQLSSDPAYPAALYVDQRFRVLDSAESTGEIRGGLIAQAIEWLDADTARMIVVLGDSGRGKTSFLRQLARRLPDELPDVLPILVDLSALEKALTLDELLVQHLVRYGVEGIDVGRLRYVLESGRLALLLDGFDALELRAGYENAVDSLQKLLASLTGRAKMILACRTQYFLDSDQVRTAFGERIETSLAGKLMILEDFDNEQVMQFLVNFYEGDLARAQATFGSLSETADLLGLVRNPRILTFVAGLADERLREVGREGRFTVAGLYGEIIDSWLTSETRRDHSTGLPALATEERLEACTALALRMWTSGHATVALYELSAQVAQTLTDLADRGYTEGQASHAIALGSLLVRTEEGAFTFAHRSIMEWLIANEAARSSIQTTRILQVGRMSRLMAEFFIDLSGEEAALRWASTAYGDPAIPPIARENALIFLSRLRSSGRFTQEELQIAGLPSMLELPDDPPEPVRLSLAGKDLRGQDLAGLDLRGADMHRATLAGMHVTGLDLSGADLTDADFTSVRMTGGSLRGATLTGSRWGRAAIVGTDGVSDLADAPELDAAAIASRDLARVTIAARSLNGIAFSPDGSLLATASAGRAVHIWDVTTGTIRATVPGRGPVLAVAFAPDGRSVAIADGRQARITDVFRARGLADLPHRSTVNAVAVSPDGSLMATGSDDGTVWLWNPVGGTVLAMLEGHTRPVRSVTFSPDGTRIASASDDNTARTWDTAAGRLLTLSEHPNAVRDVAFSPDGMLIASASDDGTARIWDTVTGLSLLTITGHNGPVNALAFSPDGTRIASVSDDNTARTWETAAGRLLTLSEHPNAVRDVAFSPDGTLLATAGRDGTARLWDVRRSRELATLVPFPGIGYAVLLPEGSYKLDGDPGSALWWTIKLCRFAPGELDPYVPGIRRLPADVPVLPTR